MEVLVTISVFLRALAYLAVILETMILLVSEFVAYWILM
jgi:hypothetical protein